jgi:hypothetical protein
MTDFLSSIPIGLWLMVAVVVFVFGGLVLYALHSKGDVFAELTHGTTSFKLQAKERPRVKSGTYLRKDVSTQPELHPHYEIEKPTEPK